MHKTTKRWMSHLNYIYNDVINKNHTQWNFNTIIFITRYNKSNHANQISTLLTRLFYHITNIMIYPSITYLFEESHCKEIQVFFPGITQISFDIRFDLLFMTLIRFYNQSVKRDIAKEKQTWLVLYLYRKIVTFPFSINAW